MIIPEEIKKNVINGLILDNNGCWRTIDKSLTKEKSNISRSEDISILTGKNKIVSTESQTQAYHNKETDRLDTEILKTEVVLAKKPKGVLAHPASVHKDDSITKQTTSINAENLDTKQLRIKSSKPEAPDTKLMKLNKTDIDEFIEDMPKNDLEDTSELDSVFSDIMSELDVFSNAEEPNIQEQNSTIKENIFTLDKESKKVSDITPGKKQTLGIQSSVAENETKPPQKDDPPPSKVLNDWDKARSKSGKIVLYLSAAGAIIAGIVVLLQILF